MSIFIEKIEKIFNEIIKTNNLQGNLILEKPREEKNGDFSTNFALVNAKLNNMSPKKLSQMLANELQKSDLFEKIEIAGHGFINMYISPILYTKILKKVIDEKQNYGKASKKNFKYNLELVSANPTGFLHVGHARNGAIGDSVARILKFAGYDVQTEYYTNDAGNQINISSSTLFYHYKKLLGLEVEKPEEMYGGDMYIEVAQKFIDEYGNKFKDVAIKENRIDNLEVNELFKEKSIEYFMKEIKKQLEDFGVEIELYTSEAEMYKNKEIEKMLEIYQKNDKTYFENDALWLKTTQYGDDKDRVLIKSNGDYTYITPDIACHHIRIQRSKANKYINFWGGDHHGYIPRIRAGLALLGHDLNILDIDMIQMVRLMKNGQEYKMSKRKGTAVWLIDLIEMVGKDSVRYMLVSKTPSSHMDFDLDLAINKNSTNPVYYAQYATARCFKILEKIKTQEWNNSLVTIDSLSTDKEKELILLIDRFSKEIEYAASSRLPNIICDYIQTLAKKFHSYYAETKIYDETQKELSLQRIMLVRAIFQTLSNAFNLIGIKVVENM